MAELGTQERGALESKPIGTRTRLDPYMGLLPAGVLLYFGLPLTAGIGVGIVGGLVAKAYLNRLRVPHPEHRVRLSIAIFLFCFLLVFGIFGWFYALTGQPVGEENVRIGCLLCFLLPVFLSSVQKTS